MNSNGHEGVYILINSVCAFIHAWCLWICSCISVCVGVFAYICTCWCVHAICMHACIRPFSQVRIQSCIFLVCMFLHHSNLSRVYAWNDVVCTYISINASVTTKSLDQYILSLSVGKIQWSYKILRLLILSNSDASLYRDIFYMIHRYSWPVSCHLYTAIIIYFWLLHSTNHMYVHNTCTLTAFRLPFKFGRIGTRAQWYWSLFIGISNKQFITIYQYIVLTTVVLCTG